MREPEDVVDVEAMSRLTAASGFRFMLETQELLIVVTVNECRIKKSVEVGN